MTVSADDPDPGDEYADEEPLREIVINCGGRQAGEPREDEPDDCLQCEDEEIVSIRNVYPDPQN
jgi:hypothetical protein